MLDFAEAELDIGVVAFGGICAGASEHFRGHVDADDPTFCANCSAGEEAIEPSTAAEVENGFARLEGSDGEWISAAEA